MAINKNFVVKNGIEVNTNQIYADATTGRVGIGSTQPGVVLDVQGGIAATDVVTDNLRVSGFSTFAAAVVAQDNLNVSGFSTAKGIDILGVTSTANFESLGISTFTGAVDANSFVDVAGNLAVGGIATVTSNLDVNSFADIAGQFKTAGITTLASSGGITTTGGDFYVGGDLYVADDITYDEISGRNMTISQQTTTKDINVTGVATVAGQTNLTNVNVSAAATIANLTVTGSITGSSAIGIQSGGNGVSTATTTVNFSQSGLTAATDATSGITTVTIASGVSIGLAIALGG